MQGCGTGAFRSGVPAAAETHSTQHTQRPDLPRPGTAARPSTAHADQAGMHAAMLRDSRCGRAGVERQHVRAAEGGQLVGPGLQCARKQVVLPQPRLGQVLQLSLQGLLQGGLAPACVRGVAKKARTQGGRLGGAAPSKAPREQCKHVREGGQGAEGQQQRGGSGHRCALAASPPRHPACSLGSAPSV